MDMKVIAMVAASLFALGLSAQGFAQNANQAADQNLPEQKPAAVVAPDQAEALAVGGLSAGAVAGTVAVVVATVAVASSNGSKKDTTNHGTPGTTH